MLAELDLDLGQRVPSKLRGCQSCLVYVVHFELQYSWEPEQTLSLDDVHSDHDTAPVLKRNLAEVDNVVVRADIASVRTR